MYPWSIVRSSKLTPCRLRELHALGRKWDTPPRAARTQCGKIELLRGLECSRLFACDDDVAFLDRLHRMIDRWSTETSTAVDVALVTRGEDLLARHAASRADIILLDMIMPLVNGMDTARELRQADTAVRLVFLTSSPSSRWNPTRSVPSTICSSP